MDWRPKKLDVYITKKFMMTFLIALLLIVGIVIIFDISEKIDDFVAKEAPLKAIIFDYYVNFVPYFMNMFSPLFVFITVIFFTSRMAANSEIVAILSCGVSFHRMMVPYMFTALVIAIFSLGLNLWVIPNANADRHAFEAQYTKTKTQTAMRNIHYQINPGQFVYVESFTKWNNTAYKFTLETLEGNEIVSKLSAETAVWDSTFGGWHLNKYFVREYTPGMLEDKVTTGQQMDTVINLTVTDFYRKQNTVQDLPYGELMDLIRVQEMRGDANMQYSLIEKHQRWALPFSAFILTIMGVALSSKKKRGGIGWNLAVGIALSFTYILFLRFSQMFVYAGTLPPWIALWLPNVVFALIAAALYKIAPK
ncbi:MAG: LptF/LptG family permease [Bacteroidales bacterium]|nr:LptF/LptG family permease [Bacteroidales bacterium]MBQ9710720.1 LptF/LptG family permease [Bacteroidales bacterium]